MDLHHNKKIYYFVDVLGSQKNSFDLRIHKFSSATENNNYLIQSLYNREYNHNHFYKV